MELAPDTLLRNRYRIERPLGKGGMGAVYLAYDLSLDCQVAVKSNLNPSPEAADQFVREAQLLAALRHPNLPRVIDYFVIPPVQYLVMDYIPGQDLDQLLNEHGQRPLEHVVSWAGQLASALAYLHSQNPPVIHRDIKPANIKLTPEGEVILVDFGIAKVSEAGQQTRAGAVAYTPGYAPPEQYGTGEHGLVRTGPYSDQYSLAASLYALLCGRKPVDAVERVLGSAVLSPLFLLNPSIPPGVQIVLEKAMSIRPDERFPDIDAFFHAFQQAAGPVITPSDQPTSQVDHTLTAPRPQVTGQPPHPSADATVAIHPDAPLPQQPVQKKKLSAGCWVAIAACFALGLFLTVGSVVLALNALRPVSIFAAVTETPAAAATTPAVAVAAFEQPTATPMPPSATPLSTHTALPAESPIPTPAVTETPVPKAVGQGKPVAFVSNRAGGEVYQIWTMLVSMDNTGRFFGHDFTQLTFDPVNKRQPAWSPDGARLLYTAPSELTGLDIFLLDLAVPNSAPQNLTNLPGDDTDPAWSPDGAQIAFTNTGRYLPDVRALYTMKPDGSERARLSVDFQEYAPFWTPDQDWLMYVIWARDHNYLFMRSHEFDYATPEPYDPTSYFGRLGEVADPAISPDGNVIAYTKIITGGSSIYYVDTSSRGATLSELTPGLTTESNPTWSPDSQYITFVSERDGNSELYLMTATGLLQTNLTLDPASDLDPAWQP